VTHPLVARLRDPRPETRREACARAAVDPSAVLLVEPLCRVLGDPDPRVAGAASRALLEIAKHDRELPSRLSEALRGGSRDARCWAAITLTRLEPPSLKLLPVLLDGLEHGAREVAWSSARAIVALGRLEGEVLPVLLHFVEGDERPGLRRLAVFALRELAPDRPETTRALLAASRDPDRELRRAALSALAVVLEETGDACDRLLEVLRRDPDPASRGLAASALGVLASRAPERTGEVREVLRGSAEGDAEPLVRRAAQAALERSAATDPSAPDRSRRAGR
jgi:HEAT repeat protein